MAHGHGADPQLIHHLKAVFTGHEEVSKTELCSELSERMGKSIDTISRKLRYFVANSVEIESEQGTMQLVDGRVGKQVIYRLLDASLEQRIDESILGQLEPGCDEASEVA